MLIFTRTEGAGTPLMLGQKRWLTRPSIHHQSKKKVVDNKKWVSTNCGRSIFLDYVSATARIYGSANDISHHNYHIFNLLRLIYKNISSHPKDSISYINGIFSTLERAKQREYDIWCSFTLVRYH